jgi:hypothetical protein
MKGSEFRGCPYSNTGAVSDEGCTGIVEQIRSHKDSIRKFLHQICAEKFEDKTEAAQIGDRIFLLYSGAATESQNLKAIWPVEVARAGAVALLS